MQAVVFDFDGPLFDGRKPYVAALASTIGKFPPEGPSGLIDPTRLPLLNPRRVLALMYAETELTEDTRTEIDRYYAESLVGEENKVSVDPAVREVIQSLNERGTKLAIVSWRETRELCARVEQLGLAKFFSLVLGGLQQGGESGALRRTASEFECDPQQLLFVGDSDWDYMAARDAKVPYYHAAWSGEPCSLAHRQAQLTLSSAQDLSVALAEVAIVPTSSPERLPDQLKDAIRLRHFSFFAGAGASIPSGLGGWDDHYLPLLKTLGAGPYIDDYELPQLLQLLASDPARARNIFSRFYASFRTSLEPNAYHCALLKSKCEHIWTINYDNLFERALSESSLDVRIVKNDEELLQSFESRRLILKMNGDFEVAKYDDQLDWGIVFLEEQFDMAEKRRGELWRLLEDDYRSKSIIFVGVSFEDHSLRRLITAASKNIPRTRYSHYLLAKAPSHQAEWVIFDFYRKYLSRYSIQTLCFKSYDAIERFVRQIAVRANRPVIGFSGSMPKGGAPWEEGMLDGAAVSLLCNQLGQLLARLDFRVTSGHGNIVGAESVEGAFTVNPLAGRFYLRQHGKTQFSRMAPAVIVPGDSLEAMRDRFIPECELLFAVGGDPAVEQGSKVSGTVSEIERAERLGIPVLILAQAGGAAGAYAEQYLSRVDASYSSKALANRIRDANRALLKVPSRLLLSYLRSDLAEMIQAIVAESFGSFTKRQDLEAQFEPW